MLGDSLMGAGSADLQVELRSTAVPSDGVAPGTVVLWVGEDGQWWGRARPAACHDLLLPAVDIDDWSLPGPGLHVLASARGAGGGGGGSATGWRLATSSGRDAEGPFSRQAGALGWEAIESMRQRRFALVGCGRNGHALAVLLAALQPREIVLIDPDRVEPGNVDAGLAYASLPDSEPRPKVRLLAQCLAERLPCTRVVEVAQSIHAESAARQAAACDVIVSATDEDSARFGCAALASAFHRIHLDVGSLVSRDPDGQLALGADIRLMVPGDRDLCCLGGLASVDDLERFALAQPLPVPRSWQVAKAGALTSWSTVVAGLAVRMLEDMAAGRLRHSHWLRIVQDSGDLTPRVQGLTAAADPYCPLCAVAGQGAPWLQRVRDLAAAAVLRARRAQAGQA